MKNAVFVVGIKPSPDYIRTKIYGADIYSPDGTNFRMEGDNEKGVILDRKIFDKSIAAEAINSNDTSSKFLKIYENMWKNEIGDLINRLLKYRKVFDKLSDKELNALSKFMKGRDLDNITVKSLFVLAKESPSLFRLLKDVI